MGRAPLDEAVDVEAGRHVVGAEWNGVGAYGAVEAEAGRSTSLEVKLPPPDPPRAADDCARGQACRRRADDLHGPRSA